MSPKHFFGSGDAVKSFQDNFLPRSSTEDVPWTHGLRGHRVNPLSEDVLGYPGAEVQEELQEPLAQHLGM